MVIWWGDTFGWVNFVLGGRRGWGECKFFSTVDYTCGIINLVCEAFCISYYRQRLL